MRQQPPLRPVVDLQDPQAPHARLGAEGREGHEARQHEQPGEERGQGPATELQGAEPGGLGGSDAGRYKEEVWAAWLQLREGLLLCLYQYLRQIGPRSGFGLWVVGLDVG